MKIKNWILVPLAIFLAMLGTFAGTRPAGATEIDPNDFWPTCLRAPRDDGQMKIWLTAGTLYSPTEVKVGDIDLYVRRDGTFIGVIDKPLKGMHNWVLFDYNNEANDVWAKCKKITPGRK